MPEGDTVWRAARRLDALAGQTLTRSDFRTPGLATRDLVGRQVVGTHTHGKNLLTRIEGDVTLHSHLRMEGRWAIHPIGTRWRRPAHTARVVLRTEALEAVGFSVHLRLVATSQEATLVGHLGPDLLADDFAAAEAEHRIRRHPQVPIGIALLDQRNLAGIGNVYRAELCFLSGLDPWTPVAQVAELGSVLDRARTLLLANRDRTERITTGRDRIGERLWVYGRRGPCLRCGTPIRRGELGELAQDRIVWWCPTCQPALPGAIPARPPDGR